MTTPVGPGPSEDEAWILYPLGIGTASLSIPNPLNIGPIPFFGPTRLFPNYAGITC